MSKIVTFLLLVAVLFVLHQTETRAESTSAPRCSVNETFYACGNSCWEGKCNRSGPIFCPDYCLPDGACECATNYYRNEDNNQCVLLQDCP